MTHSARMTIKPHLFYSSLVHFVLIAYILSIPIYKGSPYSMSFGPYSVNLVSEGRPAPKARGAFKTPQPRAGPSVREQTVIAKTESPVAVETPAAVDPPKAEEPVSEPTAQLKTEPEGITLIPEEPAKPTIIAKAEREPVIEHKPKPDQKPEPPKPEPPKLEPVVIPPPPAKKKPEPEIVIKELALPKEPAPARPVEPKPSKADTTEEPSKAEFPVKPGEKAEDVSPSENIGKTPEAKIPDIPVETSMPTKESEDLNVAKTIVQPPKIAPTVPARAEEGDTKSLTKTGKNTAVKIKGQLSRQKSEIASPSARNDNGKSGLGTQGDSSAAATGKSQTAGITLPNVEKPKDEPQQQPPLGIAVSEALFYRDIKIEVSLQKAGSAKLKSALSRKTHPSVEEYRRQEPKDVALTEESDAEGKMMIFSVAKAEKGIYTLVMHTAGDSAGKVSVMIRLLEGKKGARNRKFESIGIGPESSFRVKFMLPECIFWDDESYFTGSIESSESLTKFNDATGIVWKEEKD